VDKLSPPVLQATEVSFAYPDAEGQKGQGRMVLEKVSFSVQLNSRIAIVGANGAGKVWSETWEACRD
jgi:ATP-binding cassette subfamily F protein 3